MRLNQIRIFLSVVESGSLRAAARRLGITQPAISKVIRQLEEDLESTLLQRSPHGVTLTPMGRAFLARARLVDTELARAREELADMAKARSTAVGVGVATVIGGLLVPDAVARYRRSHPDGAVRVMEGTLEMLLPQVRDRSLDFAVCQPPDPPVAAGLKFRPLLRTRLVVAGRAGHPLGGARSLAELRDAQWMVFRPAGAGGALENAFRAEGLGPPRAVVHCTSHAVAMNLLACTDLLGLLAAEVLAEPWVRGRLEQITLQRPVAALTMGVCWRADAPLGPAATEFAAALRGAAKRLTRPI